MPTRSSADRHSVHPNRVSRYAPAASAIVCAGIMVVGFAELGGAASAPTVKTSGSSGCYTQTSTRTTGTAPAVNALGAANRVQPRTVTVTKTKTVWKTKTVSKCGTKTVTRTGPGSTTTVYQTSPGVTTTVTETVTEKGTSTVVTQTVTETDTTTETTTETYTTTETGTTTETTTETVTVVTLQEQ